MEEDGQSTIQSNINFDLPVNHDQHEEEAEADQLHRNIKMVEVFEDEFNNFVHDDDDSDRESVSHSQNFDSANEAAVKLPYRHTLPPNEKTHHCASNLSHLDRSEDPPDLSDSESSQDIAADNSNSHSDYGIPSSHESNRNSEFNSDVIENRNPHSEPYRNANTNDNVDYREVIVSNDLVSNIDENDGNRSISSVSTSALQSLQIAGSQGDYIKQLQVVCNKQNQELEQMKKEHTRTKEQFEGEMSNLHRKLLSVENENNKLSNSLRQCEMKITNYKHENNILKGKLSTLEIQLRAETQAKEKAMDTIETYEITIQSLEQQLKDFTRPENVRRLQDQNERVIRDLKLRHQKEVLQLKEENDELHRSLNDKMSEFENIKSELLKLQKEYEELQTEKSTKFSNLSAQLKNVQNNYHDLLIKSGESENRQENEISTLKRKNRTLQDDKSELEKQNSALKDNIRVLKSEIRASEAVKKAEKEIEISQTTDPQSCRKGHSTKESSLRKALEESLQNEQYLKEQNHSLSEELNELKDQLIHWEEKAKSLESHFNESVKRAQEVQKKLEEVLPDGSIPVYEHEQKLNSLKTELVELKRKFHDVSERLKTTSSNEKLLSKENKKLKSKIAEMLKEHSHEKIKAVEKCRESCMQKHEKLREDLTSQADDDRKLICKNYDNKIAELQKEVKALNEGLDEAKIQYITLFEENKSLQSKLDSISKPKQEQDIEKELRTEYEKKLNRMKEQLESNYEKYLKSEIEKAQEEWTKQKIVEIKEFINATKKALDAEFVKCLDQEKSKFQTELTEKERIIAEYQEKIKDLKHQFEVEKENTEIKLRESFQLKWKNEINELQQSHQKEMQFLKRKYDKMISEMTDEIETLKQNLAKTSSENQEVRNWQKEVEMERQAWDKERSALINSEQAVKEKFSRAIDTEKRLRDKIKRYEKYTASVEKKHQEKMNQLIQQNDELFKSRTALKEKFEEDMAELKKKHNKQFIRGNMGSQTEEEMMPRKSFLKAQDMFIQGLRKIKDEINTYLLNSRKRTAEQIQRALYFYHDQLTSKLFQDVPKDIFPFPSSTTIAHSNANSQSSVSSKQDNISQCTVQQQSNANFKISNSITFDRLASGDTHNRLEAYNGNENAAKIFHCAKSSGNLPRFDDISFDFVPIMPESAFMSTKLPDRPVPGRGLFSQENILKNSYPERPSPISRVK